MSDAPQIARLQQVDIRAAWPHESQNFTPWLYQNLDALGEAVGMLLDGEGLEVSVETFWADILATNRLDGTRVLIENQLECSDHSHLGQILTYLAGLDAKTIIWVASEFREAHLSAINWLNENTDDSISFFAVRLKVVQIAGSPFAPVFDVVARPNNWERKLHAADPARRERSELSQKRFQFWEAFVKGYPSATKDGQPTYWSNRWRILPESDLIISLLLAKRSVGIFLRGPSGSNHEVTKARLLEHEAELSERLGVPIGNGAWYFFDSDKSGDFTDQEQHPQLIQWLGEKVDLYERTCREIFESGRKQE